MLVCIGGVCVPYTAVVPIVVLALKWLVQKLAQHGLVPRVVLEKLRLHAPAASTDKSVDCGTAEATATSVAKTPSVKVLQDDEDFDRALDGDGYVVAKFTATWCKPCHRIQPVFEEISGLYKGTFFTVDVDDFDEIASRYKIAMMPTFVILHNKQLEATYSGSDEQQLRTFFRESGMTPVV